MKLPPFELRVPRNLEEALAWRAALGSDGKILAGGQSLLPMMRYRMVQPHALIDISRLAELRGIGGQAELRLGAAVTHGDIERASEPGPLFDLLRAHARDIAFLPVRTKGTVVGSLVHADPAGDWPLLFSALQASVEIASVRGSRQVALSDFIRGALDTDVQIDEIVVAVSLPAAMRGIRRWGRYKLMHRVGEYASASALAIQHEDGRWICWLGALDPSPLALPGVAHVLDTHATTFDGPALKARALAEIHDARPDCDELAALRHATAMVRAVQAAHQGVPS